MPTSAPTNPPTAPPTPTPASPAMIGPAAINGPRPGIANAPMPKPGPQGSPNHAPSGRARGCSFGGLGIFLVCELLRTLAVGKEHRDVIFREARFQDSIDGAFCVCSALIDTEYCCVFCLPCETPFNLRNTSLRLDRYLIGHSVRAAGDGYSLRHDCLLFVIGLDGSF